MVHSLPVNSLLLSSRTPMNLPAQVSWSPSKKLHILAAGVTYLIAANTQCVARSMLKDKENLRISLAI